MLLMATAMGYGSALTSGKALGSQALRQRAGITREVVILGVMDQIEIWDKARWTEKAGAAPSPEELSALARAEAAVERLTDKCGG